MTKRGSAHGNRTATHLPIATLALLVAAAHALLVPHETRAQNSDALRVQWTQRVAEGERPKLVLTATRAVGPITVTLTDDAGSPINARFGRLNPGARVEVPLSGAPGRHHYEGNVTVSHAGQPDEVRPLAFDTVVAPRLTVTVDRAQVDLLARRLTARLSRPAARAEIAVLPIGAANDDATVRSTQELNGAPANTPLVITWPALPGEPPPSAEAAAAAIARIDVRVHDVDGFWAGIALLPWRVNIPHEEVTFATDSATIAPEERPKLEASWRRIADAFTRARGLGAVKLFIAGHTDTVGTPAHNQTLSRARAAAIAAWFAARLASGGTPLPIYWEGFGETTPAVKTPDETDEPRNRRVDYILALEEPAVGPTRPTWKAVAPARKAR